MPEVQLKLKQVLLLLLLFAGTAASGQSKAKSVPDFRLKNVDGNFVALSDYADARGFIVVFTCNHCPFAKLYPPRLNSLNARYKALGVALIAISATDTVVYEEDSYAKMAAKARAEHFNFPYLYDDMQTTARSFGAQKTPHAYVLWKEQGDYVVKYNGAIDDNGAEPAKVTRTYLADAVDDLLAGRQVALPETKSIGCQINLRK
jgi:peroxiredoxin